MADREAAPAVVNGDHAAALDMWEVRQTVLSNSTKRRSTELHSIHEKLVNGSRSCTELMHTYTHTHTFRHVRRTISDF